MLNNLIESISNKVAAIICAVVLTAAIGGTGYNVVVTTDAHSKAAKTSSENSTKAFNELKKEVKSLKTEVETFSSKIGKVSKMAIEIRGYSFSDKLRNLSKQSFKLAKDPSDIKPQDMVAAVDFCSSELLEDYKPTIRGSDIAWIQKACDDCNIWLADNQ